EPPELGAGPRIDPPVVRQPSGGEELGYLMDVAVLPDLLPGFLDEVMRNDQAVLLERHEVAAVVVGADPPAPHLRLASPRLATVLGAVLDQRADGRVHHMVVIPPDVSQIA